MFRRILLPLDGTPLTERAVPYARVLARSTGASVSLVHPIHSVHGGLDAASPLRVIAEAETYLTGLARSFAADGLRVETSVPPGQPQQAVLDALHDTQPDLVVLPLPVHAGLVHWVGVAETILANTAQPNLIVPTWGAAETLPEVAHAPRFALPLDGSPAAEATLPFALALARHLGSEIALLRVVSPFPALQFAPSGAFQCPDEALLRYARDAEIYLERIAAGLRRDGCTVTAEVRIGWPSDTIAEMAREQRAAFVLLPTTWQGADGHTRLGGVARGILRHGGAAVLLVGTSVALLPQPTRRLRADAARVAVPVPMPAEHPPLPARSGQHVAAPTPTLVAVGNATAERRGERNVLSRLRAALGAAHDATAVRSAHRSGSFRASPSSA